MKKIFYVFVVSLFVFGNCKKNDTPAPASFLIVTAGSNWTYQNTSNGTTSTYKLTVKGTDSTINGKAYKVLTNSNGPNNYWYNSGTDYYRYGILPGATILASAGGVEELYLKDGAVNSTWTGSVPVTVQGTNVTLNLAYKIVEVGATKTVQGKSYTDVIRVGLTITTTVPLLGSITLGTGDFYYARGIGMISYGLNINANAAIGIAASSQTTELTAYEIK